ncbi:MAG: ergothioneine biosynthesis protein EgtB [Saprospiraceae bacterium]|nr:ergothioneine biosynthesis protein EgtB [Saprospiraceae bacterium]
MSKSSDIKKLISKFLETRQTTSRICEPLAIEDYIPQPIPDVSPPKWHLAHSTWFFEQLILVPYYSAYKIFNPQFSYLFNSYYNNLGDRVLRKNRGFLTRPTVAEIYEFRSYVDEKMLEFMERPVLPEVLETIEIGINHEQQHQELLAYDIKYILGSQPFYPPLGDLFSPPEQKSQQSWLKIDGGIKEIGAEGEGFVFDNELPRHQVLIRDFEISNRLVLNGEFVEFIDSGGYQNFNYWHSEGWDIIQSEEVMAPLYWVNVDGEWCHYTFKGLQKLNPNLPVMHLSYYEAFAYAQWKQCRLPTEFEWEAASFSFEWGDLWEWTESAYLPYPGYKIPQGAIGEYNGKFMINQKVLRGASVATASGHSRNTYRNFFHPSARWIFSGLRLAR